MGELSGVMLVGAEGCVSRALGAWLSVRAAGSPCVGAINTMLRNQCALCAAPLAHNAPRCGICKTRYCGRACQKLHWKGGHKELCPVIKRSGGPEVIYAERKYKQAVTVAAEVCAEDTKGQTCYICTQALHWKTKEGLVRGCSCRGTAGFAHVSCLAEQAKISWEEAEANNLDNDALNKGWIRWHTCGLCEQQYHGVVACALGWACWKTYVGRPETNFTRRMAISQLGNGLSEAKHHEDALIVEEANLSMLQRVGASEHNILDARSNLASTYWSLGQLEGSLERLKDGLLLKRDVYSGRLRLNGEEHRSTLRAAYNYASSLQSLRGFEEAKALLRKIMPLAPRVLGESHELTLQMRGCYATALYKDPAATEDDLREAVAIFEDADPIARRVLGSSNPVANAIESSLRDARAALAARDVESLREAVKAMTPGDA